MYNNFFEYLNNHEDWLMERILSYALRQGYAKYTSTLKEPWRLSIFGLTESFCNATLLHGEGLELSPDEDYQSDPAAQFGIKEAKLHRERGISLSMFLGLMKYYQQSYIDLISQSDFHQKEKGRLEKLVNRFFNRVEIGFLIAWNEESHEHPIIQELQQKNRLITNEKNKYLTIFESLSMPVFIVEKDGTVETMNYAASSIIKANSNPGEKYYGESYEKSNLVELFPWLKDIYEDFIRTEMVHKDYEESISNENRHFFISCSKSLDLSGKFTEIIVIIEDITERKKIEQELERLATTDPLTGAKNRRCFLQLLEQEVIRHKRYQNPLAILMLDIDHFKEINDTHGHDIGDRVLQTLVIEAHRTIRDSDTFARWGGEEFIILLPETNMHNASTMAERLRRQLSKTELNVTNATSIRFTVSIGLRVVSGTDADIGVREIINDADRAMYQSKLDGRNTVSLSE